MGPMRSVCEACEDLQLQVSLIQAKRLRDELIPTFLESLRGCETQKQYQFFWDGIERSVAQLEVLVEDESSLRAYLCLRPEQTALYESVSPFGDLVIGKFPSIRFDLEESSKCLALERATACVFHLMRILEVGLRTLGKSLNDPNMDPKRNPSWDKILKKCDDQLRLPRNDRCEEWRVDDAFFSEATANLRAVKDAWRNPTVHVERIYDPERGAEVFLAVKGFMRHLASKLTESEGNDTR